MEVEDVGVAADEVAGVVVEVDARVIGARILDREECALPRWEEGRAEPDAGLAGGEWGCFGEGEEEGEEGEDCGGEWEVHGYCCCLVCCW